MRHYVVAMGIFGSSQEHVDLDDLKSRVARIESAVASAQAQPAEAEVITDDEVSPRGLAHLSSTTRRAV